MPSPNRRARLLPDIVLSMTMTERKAAGRRTASADVAIESEEAAKNGPVLERRRPASHLNLKFAA